MRDAELAAGADDPDGDLAAVGDEDLVGTRDDSCDWCRLDRRPRATIAGGSAGGSIAEAACAAALPQPGNGFWPAALSRARAPCRYGRRARPRRHDPHHDTGSGSSPDIASLSLPGRSPSTVPTSPHHAKAPNRPGPFSPQRPLEPTARNHGRRRDRNVLARRPAAMLEPLGYTCRCLIAEVLGSEGSVSKPSKKRLVVVDDDIDLREELGAYLRRHLRGRHLPGHPRGAQGAARGPARRPAARHRPAGHQGLRRPAAHELDARAARGAGHRALRQQRLRDLRAGAPARHRRLRHQAVPGRRPARQARRGDRPIAGAAAPGVSSSARMLVQSGLAHPAPDRRRARGSQEQAGGRARRGAGRGSAS